MSQSDTNDFQKRTAMEGPPPYMIRKNTIDTLPPYEIPKPSATLSPDKEEQELIPQVSSDVEQNAIVNPSQQASHGSKPKAKSSVRNTHNTDDSDAIAGIVLALLIAALFFIALVTYLNRTS